MSPPFLGPSSLALWRRCRAGAPLAAGCHLGWGQGASPGPRPDPAGFRGSSRSLRRPGAGAKGCRGVLPAVPSAGVAALPLHPVLHPIDPCPDRWALPCGRGAVLPGRAGEMAFRRAWSGIQHRSLVPRQRSIRPVISRAQSAAGAWAGRGAGKCQAGRGCPGARMLGSRPAHTSHPAHPPDPSLPQFPGSELG